MWDIPLVADDMQQWPDIDGAISGAVRLHLSRWFDTTIPEVDRAGVELCIHDALACARRGLRSKDRWVKTVFYNMALVSWADYWELPSVLPELMGLVEDDSREQIISILISGYVRSGYEEYHRTCPNIQDMRAFNSGLRDAVYSARLAWFNSSSIACHRWLLSAQAYSPLRRPDTRQIETAALVRDELTPVPIAPFQQAMLAKAGFTP